MPSAIRYLAAILTGLVLLALPLLAVAQTPAPVHDPSRWHAPGFGHEHGDPPPVWLAGFLADPRYSPYWTAGFDGDFNTSPAENTVKHFAMKAVHLAYPSFVDQDNNWLDGYMVMHISSTPPDRGAMNHSVRVFIADAGGGLTIRQGWINAGAVDTARIPKRCASANTDPDCGQYYPTPRPVVFGIDQLTHDRGDGFEQWYPQGVGFFFGWGVNATTLSTPGEKATDVDPHAWHATGEKGQTRLVEVTARKPDYKGFAFWMTPLGDYVADPSSPECQPHACLLQYISPTYAGIKGRVQRDWPVPADWALPN